MKVRVILQRALFARDSRFFPSSFRLRTTEKLIDRAKYLINIPKHLIIPKPKNPVIPRVQKRSANLIFLRELGVLSAIQLNNEAPLDRAEICEVRPDRMLTPELYPPHPAAPQMTPQDSLRVGLLVPQPARVALR